MVYTVHEVAEILHCSTKTVYRIIKAGELKAKRRGRVTLITGFAILAYLDKLPDADGEAEDDADFSE